MPTPTVTPYKQLRRPLDDRIVAGVCSGIGRYFKVDPVLIRVAFAVLAVLTWGVALLAYPVMWFLIPDADGPSQAAPPPPNFPFTATPTPAAAPFSTVAPDDTFHPAATAAPTPTEPPTPSPASTPPAAANTPDGPVNPAYDPNPNVV
ncbi:PspC domain-containing protein [Actinoplanes sp. NPDC049265]|uniref:PspC domain-containing protein n=1 Tax=Actinoplanes sp. NPDC049265 TaxID=3363902 RepID=UPI00371AA4F3